MKGWPYKTPGIPDDQFIRDRVPMTKEEVRTVTLAKARLMEDSVTYDIGSGTGSIAVEAALLAPAGTVYAIERNSTGVELIKKNADLFGAENIKVVPGVAPDVLKGLPAPDRVIIGGSGGNLERIITYIDGVLKPKGRIIINAIVLETLGTAIKCLSEKGYYTEVTQVLVSRTKEINDLHMMQAENPVYIVAAERRTA